MVFKAILLVIHYRAVLSDPCLSLHNMLVNYSYNMQRYFRLFFSVMRYNVILSIIHILAKLRSKIDLMGSRNNRTAAFRKC